MMIETDDQLLARIRYYKRQIDQIVAQRTRLTKEAKEVEADLRECIREARERDIYPQSVFLGDISRKDKSN